MPPSIPDHLKLAAANIAEDGRGLLDAAGKLGRRQTATALNALSQTELLDWLEKLTEGTATIYDKAFDAEYLRSRIGGGNHRLHDGGHDLLGAWQAVQDASPDDTLVDEIIGAVSALWKDASTEKGLPFVSMSPESYDAVAEWTVDRIPFVSRDWLYDILSYDAFEVLASGLGIVSVIFALSSDDIDRLAEVLGSMGVIAVISANPILGIASIVAAAHAYVKHERQLSGEKMAKGAVVAGVGGAAFALLGLPFLVELVIAVMVVKLARDTWDGRFAMGGVVDWLKERLG